MLKSSPRDENAVIMYLLLADENLGEVYESLAASPEQLKKLRD